MLYNVTPRYQVLIENITVSVHGIRPKDVVGKPVEFQMTISNGAKDVHRLQLAAAVLRRDQLIKLREEIDAALALTPATSEEVRNHLDHQAWQIEKERGW